MEKTDIDIAYVANLARLEIAPERAAQLQKELESIVGYIAELGEVDDEGARTWSGSRPTAPSFWPMPLR